MLQKLPVIKLNLRRNLVKSLKQGQAWVYAEAIEESESTTVGLGKLFYKKNFVAWGIYDPLSPLRFRLLSQTENFSSQALSLRIQQLWQRKQSRLERSHTNCYRLCNGEGDFVPGLVIDKYADLCVVQADGEGPYRFYDFRAIGEALVNQGLAQHVFFKARNGHEAESKFLVGEMAEPQVLILENNMKMRIAYRDGQKTGYFIDQRLNRQYVRSISRDQSVLNLFSYTGGFSVAAGLGGARKVVSVDIAAPAIEFAQQNWLCNDLPAALHSGRCQNVFDYLQEEKTRFDIVICDPPSFAHREKDKEAASKAYIDVFMLAAQRCEVGGSLVLSSCSSHIRQEEFLEIAREAVSRARRTAKVVYVGSQAPGHCFPLAFVQMQYLKFLHLEMID